MQTIKDKLLFVNQSQFGYHIDYLQYCKFLKKDYEISFICWDYKIKKIEEPEINITYISRDGNQIIRNIRFILYIFKILKQNYYSLVFIHFFRGSSLLPLFFLFKKKMHLDIRTGSISKNIISRTAYNNILRFESYFFNSISIISVGLRHRLHINKSAYILPLGANPLFVNRTLKYKIHLLYVGTLSNRSIEDTIDGMYLYLTEHPSANIYYTIIGEGWQNEKQNLQKRIIKLGLQKHIELIGYVPYNELIHYYQITNVGISYIPITPYFKYQPATKTFEYLMAGMPVIATKTYENMRVINQHNGILINDNPKSFASGVAEMYNRYNSFNENIIRESIANYEWCKIINNMKEALL